jgi:hypothetical protein
MLEAIIARAMAPNPAERFGSALEFESQLAAFERERQEAALGGRMSNAPASHSPTLTDSIAPVGSYRPTAPGSPPSRGAAVLAIAGSAVALLTALAGAVLVLTYSKKQLGGSSSLLIALFGTVAIGGLVALVGSALRRG